MQHVIIASTNPVKIQAVREGFLRMFPGTEAEFTGADVPSGVSAQPMGDEETLTGAESRVRNARTSRPDAAYWIGIEGGVAEVGTDMEAFAWVVIEGRAGVVGKGRTGTFVLPPRVAALIQQGKELGEADDIVFGQTNSKQKMGAVGLLTDNVIDRAAYYEQAVILAFIPFKHPEHYSP